MAIKIRHDGQWVEVGVGSSVADGDYGDIIVSNSGATWTLDSSISGDKITEGNTEAEVVDTGSNVGYFKVTTEGTERLRIGPSGQIGLSGPNYGTSGQVLTSNGSGSAPTWQDSGSSTFIGLSDTPSSFTADKWIKVNSAGNALEFVDQPSGGGGNTGVGTTAQEEPVGTIIAWGGPLSSIPDNYQLCDGGTPQTSTLQDLLGTGANVPDLRDRFIIGAGNNYSVDATGGSADATLVSHSHTINNHTHSFSDSGTTGNQSQNHTHDFTTDSNGNHQHQWGTDDNLGAGGGSNNPDANGGQSWKGWTSSNGAHTHSGTTSGVSVDHNHSFSVSGTTGNPSNTGTSSEGSSATGENLPPYYALCYIIKHTSSTSGSSSITSGDGFVLLGRKSATGTSVEFTGIPANALEMTLMFEGVSGNTATDFDVQLGTSNGYITSNYNSSSQSANGDSESNSTSSFVIKNQSADFSFHGSMIINKSSSNSYSQIGQFKRRSDSGCDCYGSVYSISGVVDRLKVSISSGTFDASGLIGLSYKTSGFGGGGSNSGIGTVVSIEDDGSPVGTASTINFGDNLEVGLSGGVATITGVGTFSGDYNDLENTPTIFSGDYDDLTNKPTIPTNTSDLNNDSGFIGAGQTFSGDYNDLTNVPQMFGIPSGGIIMWSGAENLIGSTNAGGTGTGWVLCDGQTYTVDGVSVTPPDLRNRFVVGAGSGGNYNVGDTGGSDNVTLSSDEMPSHNHGSSSVSVSVNSSGLTVSSEPDHTHGTGTLAMDGQGAHNHNVRFYGGGTSGTVPSLRFDGGGHVDFATLTNIGNHAHNMSGSTGSGGGHNHSISGSISGSGTLSMSGEGGGQAHENRPPYYALCYIMKT